eukprot:scaffold834_cov244-Pinguiococcus_pyrenoidosus.AAC.26
MPLARPPQRDHTEERDAAGHAGPAALQPRAPTKHDTRLGLQDLGRLARQAGLEPHHSRLRGPGVECFGRLLRLQQQWAVGARLGNHRAPLDGRQPGTTATTPARPPRRRAADRAASAACRCATIGCISTARATATPSRKFSSKDSSKTAFGACRPKPHHPRAEIAADAPQRG